MNCLNEYIKNGIVSIGQRILLLNEMLIMGKRQESVEDVPCGNTVALVVPLIAERMGQFPLLENSEDVRLQMINFLDSGCMTQCSGDILKLVVGHLIRVLCISIGDQFYEIKKGASRVIVVFIALASKEFSETSEKLLRVFLPNMGHIHSKVVNGLVVLANLLRGTPIQTIK